MHCTSLTSLALALGLGLGASASPIINAPRAGGPSVIDGVGFQLAVQGNLSSLDPENAAGNAWVLGMQRVSTGLYASVVGPRSRNKTENPTFYFNTTDSQQQTLNIDIPGVFPMAAAVSPPPETTDYPGEGVVSFVPAGNSRGTEGLAYIRRAVDGIPVLGYDGGHGSWAVCKRPLPLPSGPVDKLMLRLLLDADAVATPPADCVAVDFVLLCADLPALQPGDSWDHDDAGDVKCVAQ